MRRLRPTPLALCLTAALAALALAKTLTPAYEARANALRAAADAQRQKLHLDENAACQKDSTPEIRFTHSLQVHPGQSFHVAIPGTFHGSPGPVFRSDAVQVTHSRVEKDGLQIDGKVAKDALPGEVRLDLVRGLCSRTDTVDAIEIVSDTRWDVAFPNGWKVGLVCGPTQPDGTNCQGTWTGKGGPQVMRATLRPNDGGYDVRYELNAAQAAAAQAKMQEAMKGPSPEIKARMEKAQAAFGACGKLPQAKAITCMQERSPAMQKAADDYNTAMQKLAGPEGPPFLGCESTRFEVAQGQVTASGDRCGAAGRLENGKGTVQVTR